MVEKEKQIVAVFKDAWSHKHLYELLLECIGSLSTPQHEGQFNADQTGAGGRCSGIGSVSSQPSTPEAVRLVARGWEG